MNEDNSDPFDEIRGSALRPYEELVKEFNKLSILIQTILSTYSKENKEIILSEYDKRLSEHYLKKE
jgi:hypothetical protein